MMFFALADGNHTAMRNLAYHVLELDGCMHDAKVVHQAFFHIAQDAFTD
jgi:hypothetical protein